MGYQKATAFDTKADKLHNLGVLFDKLGSYDQAMVYYEQALAIQETSLGKNHPSYATTLNNLAMVCKAKGVEMAQLPFNQPTFLNDENDEYDIPLHDAYAYHYHKEWANFMGPFLGSALKGNDFIHKALIIGMQGVTGSSLLSGLNNVASYTLLHSVCYADRFGFTEEETDGCWNKLALKKKA